jgi:outer membrane immunogenic protein
VSQTSSPLCSMVKHHQRGTLGGLAMKKFLLGSVGLAAMLAGPAMAADMRAPPPPPPVAYYDWSGAYIGFNVGGVWDEVTRHFPTPGGPSPDFQTSDSQGIFGFHAGAQWQWGAWVLGAEAALSGCFQECRSTTVLAPPLFTPNTTGEHKITNLFTVGPRLGYAWDRLMIFATGGWASANLKGTYCGALACGPNFTNQNGASRSDGWYAGGGFDYMVHKGPLVDVVLGLEYQHFDVGSREAFRSNIAANNYDLEAKGDIVRARLTIKTSGYSFYYR